MSTQMTTPEGNQEGNPDEKYQITTPTGNKPQMATLDDNSDDNTNWQLVMSSGDDIYVAVWFVMFGEVIYKNTVLMSSRFAYHFQKVLMYFLRM
jgi:hypothetical protein